MATLVSPGVNVSVVDESAYGAPGAGTVPLLLVATRQDKSDPTGSEADGIAKQTKSAVAGNVVKVTSQRELTQFFGNPIFTTSGTSIVQGSETSEYGLMAAYSYLGQGSQAFIVRADLNLAQLDATTTTPTSPYSTANGLWLDTDASRYGIHEWSATNNSWENKIPTVVINATGAQAPIDGDATFNPNSLATPSAATNDTYLVVLHVDNEIATTAARQMSLQYFHGTGGAWELIDNSLASGTATYDEHYSAPGSPAAGDIWIKTTSAGNGIDLKFFAYSSTSTAFLAKTVQGISTTQTDGAGAIGDFVPQDGSSATVLSASTAVVGNLLLDQQANTRGTIIVREVVTGGAVGALTTPDLQVQANTPTATAATGQYWHDATINDLDIYEVDSGFARKSASYSTTAPTSPSAGDIWVDTSLAGKGQANERAYPKLYKRNAGNSAWVLHSNTDQTTSNGVLFADITDTASDNSNGGKATTITGAPSSVVYPAGMLVVNMAQSANTVRKWNGTAWRNGVGNHADGSGKFGRFAQRGVVAESLQAKAAGSDLRDPQFAFSLIAAPGYPELVDEMVNLNSDRGETAFIIVDSPMRKSPTDVVNWTNNAGSATENGEDGLVTKNTFSAVYYPAGQTTEPLNGKTVTVPPSHMALFTYAFNDNISFQWFAPAGLTRGVVQNASAVGHITTENEFKAVSLTQGQRDAMYTVKLNPITTFPGQGTVIFGQKSLHSTTSALDRVNVARLVAYLRERFDVLARPFLFEINDEQTRGRAKVAFERFLADILSRRGLNDFAVVCDTSNNTPARIDRNEFYVDVAIEPSKAAEFIYIPIRLVNTGTLNATN
tara:strand:+ start:27088 stop:29595 length:2508 start_codon:yes stop_codon:yes gene_type:complete